MSTAIRHILNILISIHTCYLKSIGEELKLGEKLSVGVEGLKGL